MNIERELTARKLAALMQRPVSRRVVLKVAVGLGLAIGAGGCITEPTCKEPYGYCGNLPTREIPDEDYQRLLGIIKPIDSLLPPKNQGVGIKLHLLAATPTINGQPGWTSEKALHLFINEKLDLKDIPPQRFDSLAFHEMIHFFDGIEGIRISSSLRVPKQPRAIMAAAYVDEVVVKRNGQTYRLDRVKWQLYKLVSESTYTEGCSQNIDCPGHPYDNKAELLASTLTTLRFFPEGFMENLAQVSPPDDQTQISRFCLDAIYALKTYKPQASDEELPFKPELIQYLHNTVTNKTISIFHLLKI